jgi:hypothetical protein
MKKLTAQSVAQATTSRLTFDHIGSFFAGGSLFDQLAVDNLPIVPIIRPYPSPASRPTLPFPDNLATSAADVQTLQRIWPGMDDKSHSVPRISHEANEEGQNLANATQHAAAAAKTDGVPEHTLGKVAELVQPAVLPAECSGPVDKACQEVWGMNRIKAPTLWRKLAADASISKGWTLRGSILDNGVYFGHEDLKSQVSIGDSFTPEGLQPRGGGPDGGP